MTIKTTTITVNGHMDYTTSSIIIIKSLGGGEGIF